LLVSAAQRLLWRQPYLPQQTPDGHLAQTNAKLVQDDFSDNRAGPQHKEKFQLRRILRGDEPIEPVKLFTSKLRWPAEQLFHLEGFIASFTVGGKLFVDPRAGYLKGTNDYFWTLTGFDSLNGAYTDRFKSLVVEFSTIIVVHGIIIRAFAYLCAP